MSKRQILNGRAATREDFEAGSVIFYIPDERSVPYSLGHELPLAATVIRSEDEDGLPSPGTPVNIVQAEISDGKDVVLGIAFGQDEEGVCALEDLEILGPVVTLAK